MGAVYPVESPCLKVVYVQLSATGFLRFCTRRRHVGSLAWSVRVNYHIIRLGLVNIMLHEASKPFTGPVWAKTQRTRGWSHGIPCAPARCLKLLLVRRKSTDSRTGTVRIPNKIAYGLLTDSHGPSAGNHGSCRFLKIRTAPLWTLYRASKPIRATKMFQILCIKFRQTSVVVSLQWNVLKPECSLT